MKLTELEPKFLKWEDDTHFRMIDEIAGADGLEFLCPACFKANNGAVGTHGTICWTPKVPQTTSPTPGRWNIQGTGYHNVTLVAGSSSVSLPTASCKAHFFVRSGEIVMC
jgi:hypothetical protein